MPLTVWEFMDQYSEIVNKSRLDPLKEEQIEILDMVQKVLSFSISENCAPEIIPDNEIVHEEMLKQEYIKEEVISQMCIFLNNEIQYESALANYKSLIKNPEELEIFLDIIDIYEDNWLDIDLLDEEWLESNWLEWDWLEDAIDYVKAKGLINIIPKDSYLYYIVEWLHNWEDIENIMINKLKGLWIDLKVNSAYKESEEITEFLNSLEEFLFWLLVKSYTSVPVNLSNAN